MKALVIGATGAVGKDLVEQLLKDESFERVDVFVRRHDSDCQIREDRNTHNRVTGYISL